MNRITSFFSKGGKVQDKDIPKLKEYVDQAKNIDKKVDEIFNICLNGVENKNVGLIKLLTFMFDKLQMYYNENYCNKAKKSFKSLMAFLENYHEIDETFTLALFLISQISNPAEKVQKTQEIWKIIQRNTQEKREISDALLYGKYFVITTSNPDATSMFRNNELKTAFIDTAFILESNDSIDCKQISLDYINFIVENSSFIDTMIFTADRVHTLLEFPMDRKVINDKYYYIVKFLYSKSLITSDNLSELWRKNETMNLKELHLLFEMFLSITEILNQQDIIQLYCIVRETHKKTIGWKKLILNISKKIIRYIKSLDHSVAYEVIDTIFDSLLVEREDIFSNLIENAKENNIYVSYILRKLIEKYSDTNIKTIYYILSKDIKVETDLIHEIIVFALNSKGEEAINIIKCINDNYHTDVPSDSITHNTNPSIVYYLLTKGKLGKEKVYDYLCNSEMNEATSKLAEEYVNIFNPEFISNLPFEGEDIIWELLTNKLCCGDVLLEKYSKIKSVDYDETNVHQTFVDKWIEYFNKSEAKENLFELLMKSLISFDADVLNAESHDFIQQTIPFCIKGSFIPSVYRVDIPKGKHACVLYALISQSFGISSNSFTLFDPSGRKISSSETVDAIKTDLTVEQNSGDKGEINEAFDSYCHYIIAYKPLSEILISPEYSNMPIVQKILNYLPTFPEIREQFDLSLSMKDFHYDSLFDPNNEGMIRYILSLYRKENRDNVSIAMKKTGCFDYLLNIIPNLHDICCISEIIELIVETVDQEFISNNQEKLFSAILELIIKHQKITEKYQHVLKNITITEMDEESKSFISNFDWENDSLTTQSSSLTLNVTKFICFVVLNDFSDYESILNKIDIKERFIAAFISHVTKPSNEKMIKICAKYLKEPNEEIEKEIIKKLRESEEKSFFALELSGKLIQKSICSEEFKQEIENYICENLTTNPKLELELASLLDSKKIFSLINTKLAEEKPIKQQELFLRKHPFVGLKKNDDSGLLNSVIQQLYLIKGECLHGEVLKVINKMQTSSFTPLSTSELRSMTSEKDVQKLISSFGAHVTDAFFKEIAEYNQLEVEEDVPYIIYDLGRVKYKQDSEKYKMKKGTVVIEETVKDKTYEIAGFISFDDDYFVSYVKEKKSGKWFICKDEKVEETTVDTSKACVLFYTRKDFTQRSFIPERNLAFLLNENMIKYVFHVMETNFDETFSFGFNYLTKIGLNINSQCNEKKKLIDLLAFKGKEKFGKERFNKSPQIFIKDNKELQSICFAFILTGRKITKDIEDIIIEQLNKINDVNTIKTQREIIIELINSMEKFSYHKKLDKFYENKVVINLLATDKKISYSLATLLVKRKKILDISYREIAETPRKILFVLSSQNFIKGIVSRNMQEKVLPVIEEMIKEDNNTLTHALFQKVQEVFQSYLISSNGSESDLITRIVLKFYHSSYAKEIFSYFACSILDVFSRLDTSNFTPGLKLLSCVAPFTENVDYSLLEIVMKSFERKHAFDSATSAFIIALSKTNVNSTKVSDFIVNSLEKRIDTMNKEKECTRTMIPYLRETTLAYNSILNFLIEFPSLTGEKEYDDFIELLCNDYRRFLNKVIDDNFEKLAQKSITLVINILSLTNKKREIADYILRNQLDEETIEKGFKCCTGKCDEMQALASLMQSVENKECFDSICSYFETNCSVLPSILDCTCTKHEFKCLAWTRILLKHSDDQKCLSHIMFFAEHFNTVFAAAYGTLKEKYNSRFFAHETMSVIYKMSLNPVSAVKEFADYAISNTFSLVPHIHYLKSKIRFLLKVCENPAKNGIDKQLFVNLAALMDFIREVHTLNCETEEFDELRAKLRNSKVYSELESPECKQFFDSLDSFIECYSQKEECFHPYDFFY